MTETGSPKESRAVPTSDDSGRVSATAHGQAEARPGPVSADPREPLGRIVHETRRTFGGALDRPMTPAPWEERNPRQQELDMQIGHAVANYALTENAITWNTDCTRCARTLDSAYAETVRREQAEAKLASISALCSEPGVMVAGRSIRAIIGDGEGAGSD